MKLISWNVNGLRSVLRKGFLDFLARPRRNMGNPGFTPEERAGFAALPAAGFVDTFREFEKAGDMIPVEPGSRRARAQPRLAH